MFESGWTQSTLENLTRLIKDGSHGTHADVADGVPFLSAKDVRDGALEIPDDCRRISESEYAAIHKSYQIAANDILLTVVGSIGRCYLMTGTEPRFSIQRSVAVIRPDGVIPEYLYHFFRSDAFQSNLKDFTNASAQGGVYLGSLAKCSVKFPTAKLEQTKIAEILSTVDRTIEQKKALIAKQQRIKTGLMQDLLTRGIDEHGNLRSERTHKFKDSTLGRIPLAWDARALRELVHIKHGYAFEGAFFSDQQNESTLLTPGNFHISGGLYFTKDNTKYYTGHVPEDYVLANGDVLVVMTDLTKEMAILGRTVILNYPGRVLHNQRIGKVDVNKGVEMDAGFLALLMNSDIHRNSIKATATGTTVRHTSPEKLIDPQVPLMKLDEQIRIRSRVDKLEETIHITKDELSKQSRLKIALMQDLLTGKKRVTALVN